MKRQAAQSEQASDPESTEYDLVVHDVKLGRLIKIRANPVSVNSTVLDSGTAEDAVW